MGGARAGDRLVDDNEQWAAPPSWNRAVGHYVTIVGYDQANFYYVDTCDHSCRSKTRSAPNWSSSVGYPGRPGIWKVNKSVMHFLMRKWDGGYMVYGGPSQPLWAGH